MTDQPIRLVIADDDEAMRVLLGLQLSDQEDVDVLAAAASGNELLDLCREHRPEAAVLDMHLPGGLTGTDLVGRMRNEHPDVRLVAYTASVGAPSDEDLMALGVPRIEKGDVEGLVRALRAGRQAPA